MNTLKMEKSSTINEDNYLSIIILEKLGLENPSQNQIDLLEIFVSTAMNHHEISQNEINHYFKNYRHAKILLHKHLIKK